MTEKIVIGRFGKTHGINGWLRVISFTDPQENILELSPWLINKCGEFQVVCVEKSRIGNGVFVKLKGLDNCDIARRYINLDISLDRSKLPLLPDNQYYLADLEGLKVLDNFGKEIGIVDRVFETGANDVLVIKKGNKELLVPYIKDVITKVDLKSKTIEIDYEF